MGFTEIVVTGTFPRPDGLGWAVGDVNFQPTKPMRNTASGESVPAIGFDAVIGLDGTISQPVKANDDLFTVPEGTGYIVTERITGAPVNIYKVVIPAASPGGTVDLADLAPAVTQSLVGYALKSYVDNLLADVTTAVVTVPAIIASGLVPGDINAASSAALAALAAGLSPKPPVRVVSTANIASRSGLPTVDGVTLTTGQRILLVGQTSGSQNGIWVVGSGSWTRPTDYATGASALGVVTYVEDGTLGAGIAYGVTGSGPYTIDTNVTPWVKQGGSGITKPVADAAYSPLIGPDTDTATSGALVAGQHAYVTTSGTPRTRALPTGQPMGARSTVENADGLATLSVTGSIRGVGASTVALTLAHEIIEFVADSAGSWWPQADHKTLGSLDSRYPNLITALHDAPAFGIFYPEAHGAKADGATDDTAAIIAADAAAAASGGTVYFQAGKTYLCSGALALTFTGSGTSTLQKPRRWTTNGGGPGWNGFWGTPAVTGTAVLDLRYTGGDGLNPAKITTLGGGHLEVDHLAFTSGGTDDFPFFFTSNTTCDIHHNVFLGHSANSGTTCVQDAIIFGGTSLTIGNGINAPFQGYGSEVHHNFFHKIRRGFVGQTFCNGIEVHQNTFSTSCGSSTGGAIEFNGQSGNTCTGNRTRGNTIEVVNYLYGIACSFAINNNFGPDGFYDATANHTAGVFFGVGAQFNEYIDGYRVDTFLPFLEDISVSRSNNYRTSHQSQVTELPYPHRFNTIIGFNTAGQGPAAQNGGGDQAFFQANQGNTPDAEAQIIAVSGTTVADGATTSGSNVVTSATAAWTQAEASARIPIKGTGIPGGATIIKRINATTIWISANATATNTGVTLNFGRAGTTWSMTRFARHHIVSTGTAPSAAVDAAAGSGATISITGTDLAMTVTLTTGTGPTTGQLCHIAPNVAYTAVPHFILTAIAAGVAALGLHTVGSTASSIHIAADVAPAASTVYTFDIVTIQ